MGKKNKGKGASGGGPGTKDDAEVRTIVEQPFVGHRGCRVAARVIADFERITRAAHSCHRMDLLQGSKAGGPVVKAGALGKQSAWVKSWNTRW